MDESLVVEDEERPLLMSNDSVSYGIISSHEEESDEENVPGGRYTPVGRQSRSDPSGGRYTPVGKSFSKSKDLRPKPVWQLPHKDYDVSVTLHTYTRQYLLQWTL